MAVGGITVTGEDRADIQAEFNVRSNGYDKAEAEKLATATTLKFDEAAGVLIVVARRSRRRNAAAHAAAQGPVAPRRPH